MLHRIMKLEGNVKLLSMKIDNKFTLKSRETVNQK